MLELPMFPLEQAVLPSAMLPLHLFEERYRALARYVVALNEPEFGVTMIERGREVGGDDLRSDVGVVARIVQAQEFPDGRWGIIAIATRRIRVEHWLHDDPYPKALVTDWPDSDTDIAPEAIDQLRAQLKRISDASQQIAPHSGIDEPATNTDDPTYGAWQLVAAAQLGALDNQRLLLEEGWHLRAALALELLEERADILEALC